MSLYVIESRMMGTSYVEANSIRDALDIHDAESKARMQREVAELEAQGELEEPWTESDTENYIEDAGPRSIALVSSERVARAAHA